MITDSVAITMITGATTTFAVIVAAWLQRRSADDVKDKISGVHTLVNNDMTNEKQTTLDLLISQKMLIEKIMGPIDSLKEPEKSLLENMTQRIADGKKEIDQRNIAAASLTAKQK